MGGLSCEFSESHIKILTQQLAYRHRFAVVAEKYSRYCGLGAGHSASEKHDE